MKTARLVIGIISIIAFAIVSLQSCAAGISNTLEENGSTSGSAGIFLALCLLVAGIVGIAARKSKGGAITAGCFYLAGALLAVGQSKTFPDLMVWAVISFIFAGVFIIGAILQKKPPTE
ncbi:hypothetical protein [Anaerosacchariphilus polymeriproducens]|uniref:Lipoprotein n=1 Tax=Anaerosacchariphilus polymeriproducens TaxID=1812858 RepID=A0A371AT71_9FIRM|nr:hypothetical protein [Anaerosacchariphilus polymeriproducens]RDU22749.1 hypothetical protein DWV06_13350 [Anaerosacchariphilus polymeriproducens]